ncbi:hypothetical protein F7Q89_15250 [Vibrio kanaloae]|nr:hypothetical protein F7Q89_15250 [Vibrio kanaloae]TKF76293.1 hypothetical protein FCV62_18605 [Vibrio kanaloae]
MEVTTSMERLNQIRDQQQGYSDLRHLMTHTVLTEFFNKQNLSFNLSKVNVKSCVKVVHVR